MSKILKRSLDVILIQYLYLFLNEMEGIKTPIMESGYQA